MIQLQHKVEVKTTPLGKPASAQKWEAPPFLPGYQAWIGLGQGRTFQMQRQGRGRVWRAGGARAVLRSLLPKDRSKVFRFASQKRSVPQLKEEIGGKPY